MAFSREQLSGDGRNGERGRGGAAGCCLGVRRIGRSSGVARRAFTIMEVLIALAVFAMASIVLASAYVGILNSYDIAARGGATDADVAFARSLVLKESDREKLEQGGEFEATDGRRVRWSVEITSTNTADLFTVAFTCEFSGGKGDAESEATTQTFTLLRPTWSIDIAERDRLREEAKTRILELQGKQKGTST